MVRFWKQKRFWIIIGIGGLLFVVSLWALSRDDSTIFNGLKSISSDELEKDKEPPTLIIESPDQGTWISHGFKAFVFEEDLETEIDMSSCTFQVCAYDVNGVEKCTGIIQRICSEHTSEVTVDPNGMCSFEGREACTVYVEAQDLAGNKGGSYNSYHIDFTPPTIEELSITNEEGYIVQAEVQDDNAIKICGLYVNDRFTSTMEFKQDCRETCSVLGSFEAEEIESRIFIRCDDIAGNSANGDEYLIRRNEAPNIASCTVKPAQGILGTDFQFMLEASDSNQDTLSYKWEVGDGTIIEEKDVRYQYISKGTYRPKVTVSDPKGLSAQCNTAWVVVE